MEAHAVAIIGVVAGAVVVAVVARLGTTSSGTTLTGSTFTYTHCLDATPTGAILTDASTCTEPKAVYHQCIIFVFPYVS